MEFSTFIDKGLRDLRKLPTKHKEDHCTLVRMRKVLTKARYLKMILSITSNLIFKGPDIGEGDIFLLFIDFTDVFNYSLELCFFRYA